MRIDRRRYAPRICGRRRQGCAFSDRLSAGKLSGMSSWLSFLRRAPGWLKRTVAEFEPDVINSHFVFPAGYVVVRSGLNLPHVTSVVGADIHDPTRKSSADRNWLVRRYTRRAIGGGFRRYDAQRRSRPSEPSSCFPMRTS